MKPLKFILVLFPVAFVESGCSRPVPGMDDWQMIDRVAMWQIQNFPDSTRDMCLDWTNGALYRGLVEWAEFSGEQRYYDFLYEMGTRYDWGLRNRIYHADDLCVGQMYVKLYNRYKDSRIIAPIKNRIDSIIANPSRIPLEYGTENWTDRWAWCDALFMEPPLLSGLYLLTGDEKYMDFMYEEFKVSTDSLFDAEYGLYYRDSRFKTRREANGLPVFWGRGNGWAFAGLALILQDVPKNHQYYPYFINLYKQMAEGILTGQDNKGSWHASMLDRKAFPLAENSGSAFFVYGLAWGINNGILEKNAYLSVVTNGWNALKCYVSEDGKLTSIQPVGASPDGYAEDATAPYGIGAFLLAGIEMIKLNRGK